MTAHNYAVSEIPNTDEGRELVRLMRKYLNRSRFKINVYGQHVKDELKGTGVTCWGQKMSESKCLRVYLKDEIETKRQYDKHRSNWAERQVLADELLTLANHVKHNRRFS